MGGSEARESKALFKIDPRSQRSLEGLIGGCIVNHPRIKAAYRERARTPRAEGGFGGVIGVAMATNRLPRNR